MQTPHSLKAFTDEKIAQLALDLDLPASVLATPATEGLKPIVVTVPAFVLSRQPKEKHEGICIMIMRKAGIPVNGSYRITGLRYGFLRAERNSKDDLTFTWHRRDPRTAEQQAAEAGVVLEPSHA